MLHVPNGNQRILLQHILEQAARAKTQGHSGCPGPIFNMKGLTSTVSARTLTHQEGHVAESGK